MFVSLARPHPNYGIVTCLPETINKSSVVLETTIQRGPLVSKRPFYDDEPRPGPDARERFGTKPQKERIGVTIETRA